MPAMLKATEAIKKLLAAAPDEWQKEMTKRYKLVPKRCPECKAELTASDSSAGYSS